MCPHKFDPNIHHRKSIRLKGYDYSQAGLYFVTIVTQNRACLFGDVVDDEMVLNRAGLMVHQIWHEIPQIHNGIDINEFVIMPNHVHGIITVGADSISAQTTDSISAQMDCASVQMDSISAPKCVSPKRAEMDRAEIDRAEMDSAPTTVTTTTLGTVVQTFKRYSTVEYIKMVKQNILPPFDKRIWQRNYWEHIIRNENEYQRIAQYIIDNPPKWALDKLNGGSDV